MIRPYVASDRDAILAINEANIPEVGPMDGAKFDSLAAQAVAVEVIELDDEVVGFIILLAPGADYASPNYGWFSARFDSFVYVDRIAINEAGRGKGFGPQLYERALINTRAAGAPVLIAEVNTVPINPRSLRFHELFGFVELERVHPYGGDEQVAMLAYYLSDDTATDD